ncbi:MAG TPA: cytochrome c [Chloroflexota bacterium]|nr:cytochrome c [Chloroflexota bacterium]
MPGKVGHVPRSAAVCLALLLATIVVYTPLFSTLAPTSGGGPAAGAAPDEAVRARGRTLFLAKGCISCHALGSITSGTGPQVGPNLTGLPAVAGTRRPGLSATQYVRESLVAPQAFVVPGYAASATNPGNPAMPRLPLSESEIDTLVSFLLSP